MDLALLENFIKTGNLLTSSIVYVPAPSGVLRFYSVYESNSPDEYEKWRTSAQRFINNYAVSNLEEFKLYSKKISPDNHTKLLSILEAIKLLPNEPISQNNNSEKYLNITNIQNQSNSQNQSNTQSIILHIFLDSIKDEITGKDYKELQQIIKENENEPEKAKSKIFDKLKSFGSDVLSNILANIITNPNLYNLIM